MSQATIKSVNDAIKTVRYDERLAAIKGLVAIFAQDPQMLSQRAYVKLRPALRFLSCDSNEDGVGSRFMDFERAEASRLFMKLEMIYRAKKALRAVEAEELETGPVVLPKKLSAKEAEALAAKEAEQKRIAENSARLQKIAQGMGLKIPVGQKEKETTP